ncbi:MAG TPA: nickel-dependent lactate racemase [Acidobacteriaceae bacterium]
MAETIELPFGRGSLEVRLPDGVQATMVVKREQPGLPDPAGAIRQVLDAPLGAEPLSVLAQSKRSACILICDITRPVPNSLFLRPMIEELLAAGISPDAITVLVATGLHRPNEGDELRELIGDPWVLETVKVENHFARNDEDHIDLGITATHQVRVKVDRRFVEADLKIATGLVEPHFMAGYSGGRKVIVPGVAHADTIRTFHSARFLESPAARSCNLLGNPLHETQMEILGMLGDVYAVNTVLNDHRELIYVTFGEVVASHVAAVEFARGSCIVEVGRKFQTVVTSAAGFPLDSTYYQTVKGMVTPLDILEPGGTLIVAAKCSEGMGSAEFREAQKALKRKGSEAFLQTLMAQTFAEIDEWQTEMLLRATRGFRVQLYAPGLSPEDSDLTCVEMIDSVEEAIQRSIERSGDPNVAVIPEGPYLIPLYKAE